MKLVVIANILQDALALDGILALPTRFITRRTSKKENQIIILKENLEINDVFTRLSFTCGTLLKEIHL